MLIGAWTAISFVVCIYVVPATWIPALLTVLITGVGYLLTVWIKGAPKPTDRTRAAGAS
jgi:hypothetical protein